jgi:copper(I)-binding protein
VSDPTCRGPASRATARPARRALLAVIVGLALGAGACGGGPGDAIGGSSEGTPVLEVGDAQASSPIAGASQLIVEVRNVGDGADRLLAVESDAALAVEIHRTEITEDGRAVMRQLDDVELPPGGTVRFRPGDLHLMLVVPDERVVVGGTFEVTLRFERSAPITVSVAVVELLDLIEELPPTR